VIDRGYLDYEWFRELTQEEVYFVTRMKEAAVCEVKAECQVRTQVWTALIAMLVLKYLQLKSTLSWSLSTLAALPRQQLFFYQELWAWLDDPFQAPPAVTEVHVQQIAISWQGGGWTAAKRAK